MGGLTWKLVGRERKKKKGACEHLSAGATAHGDRDKDKEAEENLRWILIIMILQSRTGEILSVPRASTESSRWVPIAFCGWLRRIPSHAMLHSHLVVFVHGIHTDGIVLLCAGYRFPTAQHRFGLASYSLSLFLVLSSKALEAFHPPLMSPQRLARVVRRRACLLAAMLQCQPVRLSAVLLATLHEGRCAYGLELRAAE